MSPRPRPAEPSRRGRHTVGVRWTLLLILSPLLVGVGAFYAVVVLV
ncbi:MAG: hypothetical protein OXG37_00245 [Actinomycetia bacterium]|nr:hypothetical protein [Actinomycetes bacterium]